MLARAFAHGLKKRDMANRARQYRPKHDPHNGLLNFKASTPLPGYWRYFPSPDLAPYVEHFWTIEWNLPEPALRETLPYPSAHIILEPGVAQLGGVRTKKFSRVLEGRGRVLGTKFWPGGLRPFLAQPMSAYTDRVLPLHAVFGARARNLDRRALQHADHHAAIAVVEEFLRALQPRADETLALVRATAQRIADDREMKQVEQLAAHVALGVRTLQRLFGDYIGVSPKWMIRRYRLQEAAERMAASVALDWAQIALDLGYADQAHFSRDFKRLIGKSPADYFKTLAPMPRP
jgi:AraC-like DNA-binding protein